MTLRKYQNHTPLLGKGAFVDGSAVVIGDVEIGEDSSVWPLTVIRGDMHRIRIGARTSVQDGCVLHITHAGPFNPDGFPCLIGDDVTIAHKVMLHGCSVGNRILIGMGSIVMDGAVIEDDVIVGADFDVADHHRRTVDKSAFAQQWRVVLILAKGHDRVSLCCR